MPQKTKPRNTKERHTGQNQRTLKNIKENKPMFNLLTKSMAPNPRFRAPPLAIVGVGRLQIMY